MWELNYKENWVLKNWCFWTVMLEKTLESPLDCKDIKSVHTKRNPSWIFIGRTDAEAEAPVLWPPDAKNWLIGKDPDARKDWRQEEKGMTEDRMVWWHHQLNGHEFEQALGVGDGQGSLVCCSPQAAKSLTQLSEWTVTTKDHIWYDFFYINIWNRQIYIDGKQMGGCLGLWLGMGRGKWLLI